MKKVNIELVWHPVEERLPNDVENNNLLYVTVRNNVNGELAVYDGAGYEETEWFWIDYENGNEPVEPEYTVIAWAMDPVFPPYIPEEVTE